MLSRCHFNSNLRNNNLNNPRKLLYQNSKMYVYTVNYRTFTYLFIKFFSWSWWLDAQDHPLRKDEMTPPGHQEWIKTKSEICWFVCITIAWSEKCVFVHMKLYHTQGVWPFKISTLHFTRLPYYTNLHGNLSRSSNERWRWGQGVGGTHDWRRVLRTLIGVRMVQCQFVQIHTLGKLKSHFSPSHSFICCNLMRITHPLVPLQFHALKTILCVFIPHISSSFLHQLWHSLPSGWCHLLSLQSLFLPELLSASIINPLHKLYMYNSFNLSCGNRVLHLWNSKNKMMFFQEFASEKSYELCLVWFEPLIYTTVTQAQSELKREVEENLLRWINKKKKKSI